MDIIYKDEHILVINKPAGLSIETFETPFGRIARRFVSHPYESMLRKNEFLEYLEQQGFKVVNYCPHSMLYFLSDFFLVATRK